MAFDDDATIKARVERIRAGAEGSRIPTNDIYTAAGLALSVLHDTVGSAHPIAAALEKAVAAADWQRTVGLCRSVIALFDEGSLRSPRLIIAQEIEAEILDVAQSQAAAAETALDLPVKHTHLGIAAFLAGCALEDALRRLCDAHQAPYDAQRTSLAKLQAALYQPSKGIEHISNSENKQITSWGDTRNKADHAKFHEITMTELNALILGTRAFIDKHLA